MRFFSGGRDGKKKSSAAQIYKDQQAGKKRTMDDIFKEKIEAKMQQMMEDALLGKKKGPRMPGTKADEPNKPISKSAQMMLKMLAMKKTMKDMKAEKKRVYKELMLQKAKKNAIRMEKEQLEYEEEQKRLAEAAAAAAAAESHSSSASSWWGVGPSTSDDSNSW